jgi:hypothetical protein
VFAGGSVEPDRGHRWCRHRRWHDDRGDDDEHHDDVHEHHDDVHERRLGQRWSERREARVLSLLVREGVLVQGSPRTGARCFISARGA